MTDKTLEIDTDLKPPENEELPKRIPVVGMMGLQNMEPDKKKEVQTSGLKEMNNTRRMKKDAQKFLASRNFNGEAKELLDELLGKNHNATMSQAIVFMQGYKAVCKADTKAAEFVRDTAGEKPTDKLDIVADVKLQRFEQKLIGIVEADAVDVDEDDIKSEDEWEL